jgi:hypothetical protein
MRISKMSGTDYKQKQNKEERISVRKNLGDITQLNIRLPISSANIFLKWCQDNKLSQREGLEELMRLSKINID